MPAHEHQRLRLIYYDVIERTAANLQSHYAMRSMDVKRYTGKAVYLDMMAGVTAVEEIERLLEGLRICIAVVLYTFTAIVLYLLEA